MNNMHKLQLTMCNGEYMILSTYYFPLSSFSYHNCHFFPLCQTVANRSLSENADYQSIFARSTLDARPSKKFQL